MTSFPRNLHFLFIHILPLISGLTIDLDGEDDVKSIWKVKGDAIYKETGLELRIPAVSQFLPSNFKYTLFDKSQGIWVVVPSKPKHCDAMFGDLFNLSGSSEEQEEDHRNNGTANRIQTTSTTPSSLPKCDYSANASFQLFRTQLIKSVTVWYNFGGNASIRITGGRRQSFVESANYFQVDNWIQMKKDNLEGRMVLVEAIVNKTGDYVLVDKISVETMELTTNHPITKSPHPSSSSILPSTTMPSSATTTIGVLPTDEPALPASGQNKVEASVFLAAQIAINFVFVVIMAFFL